MAQRDADGETRDVGGIRTTVTADMFSMFASATPATPTTPTKKRKMMMFASAADADAIDETNRGRDDDGREDEVQQGRDGAPLNELPEPGDEKTREGRDDIACRSLS